MNAEKAPDFTNKYAQSAELKIVRWLMSWTIVGVALHWLFQSMLYMDDTERRFKLVLDALLIGMSGMVLTTWLPGFAGWLLAFFIGHSLNFLLNAQLWVVLKHYGYVNQQYAVFAAYTESLTRRIQGEGTLVYAAIYGSQVRSEWKPSSDLDVRLVRKRGFWAGICACWFVLCERSRATWHHFPLDIYVLDGRAPLDRMRTDERPLVLVNQLEE